MDQERSGDVLPNSDPPALMSYGFMQEWTAAIFTAIDLFRGSIYAILMRRRGRVKHTFLHEEL